MRYCRIIARIPTGVKKMNWDYVAGFFDGEGTVSFAIIENSSGYGYDIRPLVKISQKDKQILEEIQTFMNIGNTVSNSHYKKTNNIHWTQRAYSINVSSYQHQKFVCNMLKDRVHVKSKQFALLNDFLELKSMYFRKTVPKEITLKLLDIAEKVSQASVKPNKYYKIKIQKARKAVLESSWSPEAKAESARRNSKNYWSAVRQGRLPKPKIPEYKFAKYIEEKRQLVTQFPQMTIEILTQAKRELPERAYLKLRKQMGVKHNLQIFLN
jgi:hypothetical protein